MQGETLFHPDSVALIGQLTEALEEVDGLEEVISVYNSPFIQGTEEGLQIESFVDLLDEDPLTLGELRAKVLNNQLFRRYLISEDGKTAALLAHLDIDIVTESLVVVNFAALIH